MPPINAIANSVPPQPTADGGHANHGISAGPSFVETLSQTIGQPAAASPHGNHGGLTTPGGDPHPQHVPLNSQGHGGKKHSVQEVALGVRAHRQQLIAANIANADTPGYKAIDIDFKEALRIAQSASQIPSTTLATTSSGHISGVAVSSMPLYPLKYQVPSQDSADGNTVDMDVERAKFAENSIMYEYSLDRVSGHFKMLMELYKNLT